MAERTGIEWADATWNPWYGCQKVSAGCAKCYAEREMTRYGKTFADVKKSGTFTDPLKWQMNEKLRERARIFTCSWSDWFIKEADDWRTGAWEIIRRTPEYDYLILTKRPERIRHHLPEDWGSTVYPNVWLLVSAEKQEQYDERWPLLAEIPAIIHGVSMEPLLGPIDMRGSRPEWVITGGESDDKPRMSDPAWFRSIQVQCAEKKIPFFHKQNGGTKKIDGAWGGRRIDGRTWDEFPKVSNNQREEKGR